MKAAFIFSRKTGNGRFLKHLSKIKKLLNERFEEVNIHETIDHHDFEDVIRFEANRVDVLVFVGGDGTLHDIVNILMPLKKKPTLLLIPGGTINDMAKSLNIPKSYKRAIRLFDKNNIETIDVNKANNVYFTYVAAIGKFVPLSYMMKRSSKKRFGRAGVYFRGFFEAFKPRKPINVTLEIDGKIYRHKTPYLIITSGRSVGGFRINKNALLNDGLFEIYATKPGLFGSLPHYLFGKIRTFKYSCSSLKVSTDSLDDWSFDGERISASDLTIVSIPRAIRIYSGNKTK